MRYIYLVVATIAASIISIRSLVYTQMNGYRLRFNGGMLRELLSSIVVFIIYTAAIVLFHCIDMDASITYVILTLSCIIFAVLSLARGYKVKPNFTARLNRLTTVFIIMNTLYLCIVGCVTHYFLQEYVYMTVISGIFLYEFLYIALSLALTIPFENMYNKRKIHASVNRLEDMPNIKVIGITGSFGKTSVKNILKSILDIKYKVKCTPASYNTPVGIAISIDLLEGDEDYFIVEMGARHMGDIGELTSMVHPEYGIITGVTAQHLSTFGSIENVAKAKYELYNGVKKACVFNGNNDITRKMYEYSSKEKSITTHNNDVYIDKVSIGVNGMSFDLHLYGDVELCHTSLVGVHYIDDILMACTLAYELGMRIEDMAKGIANIEKIPHRFEVTCANGIYIIDDSYNANIVGVEAGLTTLGYFNGRKIIATQGIVEGGREQRDINRHVGELMADIADIAIVIGKNKRWIMSGLESHGFNMSNVFAVRSLSEAKKVFTALLRSGDILYITNDLPDNY